MGNGEVAAPKIFHNTPGISNDNFNYLNAQIFVAIEFLIATKMSANLVNIITKIIITNVF
jgi:hypothetical protein